MNVASLSQDFTIDGQAWNYIENVDEDNYIRAYRDILIYVAGEHKYPDDARRILDDSFPFVLETCSSTVLGGWITQFSSARQVACHTQGYITCEYY